MLEKNDIPLQISNNIKKYNMKKYSLLFWFTAVSLFCSAQSLTFQKTEHNFSKIQEVDGEVTYSFTYENHSKLPISIIVIDNHNRALRTDRKSTRLNSSH